MSTTMIPSSARMFRWAVCIALACVWCIGCSEPTSPTKASQPTSIQERISPLEAEFLAAEAEFHVPASILKAIAYVETRWRTPEMPDLEHEDAHSYPAYGIMGLRDAAPWESLQTASDLTGLDEGQLVLERSSNIRGAAAFLRHHVETRLGEPLIELMPAEAYEPAIADYGAGSNTELRKMYTKDVYKLLSSGLFAITEEGLPMRISAHSQSEMPTVFETRQQAMTDYDNARWVPAHSGNFTAQNRGTAQVTHITIHVTQGAYAGAISWFQNNSSNVSAHYVIRSSDGEVTQMVRHKDKAWHVGSANGYTVGIEHEGWVDDPGRWFTDEMYRSSARLTRHIADTWGVPLDREHIKGHIEFPNQSHSDPGPGWDWDLYMAYVRGEDGGVTPTTGNIIGFVREGDIYNTDQPLSNVRIELNSGETTTTDSNGLYRFDGLAIGTYTITASADGYTPMTIERALDPINDTWASIALNPIPEDPPVDDPPVDDPPMDDPPMDDPPMDDPPQDDPPMDDPPMDDPPQDDPPVTNDPGSDPDPVGDEFVNANPDDLNPNVMESSEPVSNRSVNETCAVAQVAPKTTPTPSLLGLMLVVIVGLIWRRG